MHKSLRHIGKKSVGLHAKNEKIQLLNRQLSEEITLENFENAAIIRDEITRVEKD
jgi:protein-arginine kinase activator protein McsA